MLSVLVPTNFNGAALYHYAPQPRSSVLGSVGNCMDCLPYYMVLADVGLAVVMVVVVVLVVYVTAIIVRLWLWL